MKKAALSEVKADQFSLSAEIAALLGGARGSLGTISANILQLVSEPGYGTAVGARCDLIMLISIDL